MRKCTNQLYYDPFCVILDTRNLDYVVVDGFKFRMSTQLNMVQRVKGNPWFEGVRPDDIVLDIGANIGAIAIPLAFKAEKVYAVEPLWWDELERNTDLNGVDNIEVLRCGIGKDFSSEQIEFSSKKELITLVPLASLLNKIGKVDFLKIDCEGYEWFIKPWEVFGIRELRIEFHVRRGHRKGDTQGLGMWLHMLKGAGYSVTIVGDYPLLDPRFSRTVLVKASQLGAQLLGLDEIR